MIEFIKKKLPNQVYQAFLSFTVIYQVQEVSSISCYKLLDHLNRRFLLNKIKRRACSIYQDTCLLFQLMHWCYQPHACFLHKLIFCNSNFQEPELILSNPIWDCIIYIKSHSKYYKAFSYPYFVKPKYDHILFWVNQAIEIC